MGLAVSDTLREHSHAYIHRSIWGERFSSYFTLDADPPEKSICILNVGGEDSLFSLFLTQQRGIELRAYSYPTYPGIYPGFYPSASITPPENYPEEYPDTDDEAASVLAFSNSPIRITLHFSVESYSDGNVGDIEVYAEAEGFGAAHRGGLEWHTLPESFQVGCVSARDTPYNLAFDNFSLEGQIASNNWYYLKGFQGFRSGEDVLYQGAIDTSDPSTFSEYTDIRNLARYNYARPETPLSDPQDVYGIKYQI